MLKLQEVLDFIKNADQLEIAQITRVTSIRKSEVNYDVKSSFRIGDNVGINHKKISPNVTFRITIINAKNIKVQGDRGSYTVSPSLLDKK
jgi:hypothetical protein